MAGDDFQHLFTWLHALRLLRTRDDLTKIEFEVDDAGNVDDLVVHSREAPATYHQVKFARDQSHLLTFEWMSDALRKGGKSLLQRFQESYRALTKAGVPPEMTLYTNRQIAGDDPMMSKLDGVTDLLTPRLTEAKSGSAAGRARADWARHLGVSEEDLLDMLSHLQIKAGRDSLGDVRQTCCILAENVGLRGDLEVVALGCAEIRRMITEGVRELDGDDVREIAKARGLLSDVRRGSLLVQAIARDAFPEAATANVDWVELFEGNEPRERRQVRDPDSWQVMRNELKDAAAVIHNEGYDEVLVDGAFRLSTGFLVGAELSDVAGYTVAVRGREGLWESSGDRGAVEVVPQHHELSHGPDLAIGLSIAGDLSEDVFSYVEAADLPVAAFINLEPKGGTGREALGSAKEARGFVDAALDQVRELTSQVEGTLHLFQFGPVGAAVLLGHLWNRVPPTQLYDDLGPGRGYTPTFSIPA